MKKYKIPFSRIKMLVTGYGSCVASDEITVLGKKVGYMYRESPASKEDSGWRFLSGEESDSFLAESDNFEVYDVNTISNYDASICDLLKAPAGSAFAVNAGGVLEAVCD